MPEEMMEAAPLPKRQELPLGEVEFSISGSATDQNAEARATRYLVRIERRMRQKYRYKPLRFMLGGHHVKINDWRADIVSIHDGSIVIRYSLIGVFVLEFYGAIADYPSFKEAVPIVVADIKDVVSWLTYEVERKRSPEDRRDPSSVHVYFKDEDDLVKLIKNSN
jgi:hypothetical protein